MMKLHALVTHNWRDRKEYRGTGTQFLTSPSDLRKAKTLSKKGLSIPKIVEHLHPNNTADDDREKLNKRYWRAFKNRSRPRHEY